MKNKSFLLLAVLATAITIIVLPACNKKFDEPPVANTNLAQMGITANTTVAALKRMVGSSDGSFKQIMDSLIIIGVVSADDRSGNLYKEIYFQDTSGGMSIQMDASGLYSQYPVGREIAISLKGLWLVNTKGMKKICESEVINGTTTAIGIPAATISNYVTPGATNQPVQVMPVAIGDLVSSNSRLVGALVKLNNVEVTNADLFKTWSDASPAKVDQNINITDCASQIIIRSSSYSTFAGLHVAQGNGSVTALFTVYNTTPQLLIRDTTDAALEGPRCEVPDTLTTIRVIRSYGVGGTVPIHSYIVGVITSNTGNEATGNFIIQDESGYAIQMHFSGSRPYALNDKVRIDVGNAAVSRFGTGPLQITGMGTVIALGTGIVTPKTATIQDILTNTTALDWESTLVTIHTVTIAAAAPGSTGVNYTFTDASGSIPSFVRNTLGYTLPASASSITGYIGVFGGAPQLTLRVPADVQ